MCLMGRRINATSTCLNAHQWVPESYLHVKVHSKFPFYVQWNERCLRGAVRLVEMGRGLFQQSCSLGPQVSGFKKFLATRVTTAKTCNMEKNYKALKQ